MMDKDVWCVSKGIRFGHREGRIPAICEDAKYVRLRKTNADELTSTWNLKTHKQNEKQLTCTENRLAIGGCRGAEGDLNG